VTSLKTPAAYQVVWRQKEVRLEPHLARRKIRYRSERDGLGEILVVTDFFNTEYPTVGGNWNKISSDRAFVTHDVRSIVLDSRVDGYRSTPWNTDSVKPHLQIHPICGWGGAW
jgi:hypothetical protein